MKERFRKAYRHPTLDQQLTKARMTQEVRCMNKARKQQPQQRGVTKETIYTPAIYYVDDDQQRIYMERIQGITVKERLQQLKLDEPEDEAIGMALAVKIGRGIADIHSAGSVANNQERERESGEAKSCIWPPCLMRLSDLSICLFFFHSASCTVISPPRT